jgi:hypothetical protein
MPDRRGVTVGEEGGAQMGAAHVHAHDGAHARSIA